MELPWSSLAFLDLHGLMSSYVLSEKVIFENYYTSMQGQNFVVLLRMLRSFLNKYSNDFEICICNEKKLYS